ncbi:hypothetical protein DE146DRAFT_783683 [Phaeosphaeria sp. MPI-PUGE-AT-0046c]|nr:hypothetical protein DE146DRAFT_783683 [Phaeosphaeria sp. MPI-PUGE-AT-0046c]
MMHLHSPSWFVLSTSATAHIALNALIPATICTALALVTVYARWYSRIVCRPGHVGAEDWCVSVAMMMSICITGLIGGEYLLDSMHDDKGDRKKGNLSILLKLLFTQSLFYHLTTALVKSSFVLQYFRLFTCIRPLTCACYMLLTLTISAAAWGVFGVIFLCNPTHAYWDLETPNATCKSAENHFLSTSIMGIVLDWAIWVLPIPVVGRLRLPRRQKKCMLGVFGLGGVVCVVSILRLTLTHHFAHRGQVTRSGTFALTWSTIEINVAIICASLLVMKPLFARFVPAMVSEQPRSAREDARLWGGLHSLRQFLEGDLDEDEEEKVGEQDSGRRDTAVTLCAGEHGRIASPRRAMQQRRGVKMRRKSF